MKKNMFLRVASVLLVLTLLSTCAISGTFAKYVTTGATSDTARVAKWGITLDVTNETMFGKTYVAGADSVKATSETDITVKATEKNVFAPGTKGTFAGIKIAGTPEVSAAVTYAPTVTIKGFEIVPNVNKPDEKEFYCPLVFTFGEDDDDTVSGLDYTSADDLKDAIEEKIAAANAEYAAGTSVSNTLNIEWAWAFEATGSQSDAKDTLLADAEAELTIAIDVAITQIN